MTGNFATEIFKINIGFIIRSLTVAARIMDQTGPQPSNRAATVRERIINRYFIHKGIKN